MPEQMLYTCVTRKRRHTNADMTPEHRGAEVKLLSSLHGWGVCEDTSCINDAYETRFLFSSTPVPGCAL